MSLIILLFGWLFTFLIGFTRCKRLTASLIFLNIILLLFLGSGLPTRWLLAELQTQPRLVQPQWAAKNAIVLLGFGNVRWPNQEIQPQILAFSRIAEAARLYRLCHAAEQECRIIATGGDPAAQGVSEADVMSKTLVALGVPAKEIQVESKSENTYQNAEFTAEILKSDHPDKVVLVTSGFHEKRALLYFQHFGIQAVPAPADHIHAPLSWWPQSRHLAYFDLALHEVLAILKFKKEH